MKFCSAPLLLPALLCLGLAAAQPASAGPLKSIGSGLKKVGNALTPWKKSEPAPAPPPRAQPVKAAPKPTAKAAPAKAKTKPVVAQKKKSSAPVATASKKKSTSTTARNAGAATAAAGASAGAAGATGPETPNDPTKDTAATGTDAAADTPPTTVEASAAPIPLAELPFGTPVMGRKGYVRSPFSPDDGLVDVTDIAAGTKVKCPFSGKVFRVP